MIIKFNPRRAKNRVFFYRRIHGRRIETPRNVLTVCIGFQASDALSLTSRHPLILNLSLQLILTRWINLHSLTIVRQNKLPTYTLCVVNWRCRSIFCILKIITLISRSRRNTATICYLFQLAGFDWQWCFEISSGHKCCSSINAN